MSTVFGLDVYGDPPEDSHPIEVIGMVKFMDVEGNIVYWSFHSEGLPELEAIGMARGLSIEVEADYQSGMYYADMDLEDEDEDD